MRRTTSRVRAGVFLLPRDVYGGRLEDGAVSMVRIELPDRKLQRLSVVTMATVVLNPKLPTLVKESDTVGVADTLEHGTPTLSEQRDAILIAAKNGDERVMEVLLEYGVPVNLTSQRGTTALMQAAHQGHQGICDILLAGECSVDMQNDNKKNALMLAILAGHAQIVKKLLTHGASPEIREHSGGTALFLAAGTGRVDICRALLSAMANVDARTHGGLTPLMAAARGGHERVCELLIEEGHADVQKTDQYGRTPLIIAATEGLTDACRLLVLHGSNIDHQSSTGITATMAAIDSANQECIKFFVQERHANVSLTNSHGANALSFAAKRGYLTICHLLLERGVSVESANNRGTTALMVAANNGHLGVCKLLLENGADAKRKNTDRANAIDCSSTRVVAAFLLRWIGEDVNAYFDSRQALEGALDLGGGIDEGSDDDDSDYNEDGDDDDQSREGGLSAESTEGNRLPVRDSTILQIVHMGFDRADVVAALVKHENNVDAVIEMLLERNREGNSPKNSSVRDGTHKHAHGDRECSSNVATGADTYSDQEKNNLHSSFREILKDQKMEDYSVIEDLETKLKAFYDVCEGRNEKENDKEVSAEDRSDTEEEEATKADLVIGSALTEIPKEIQAFICPITQEVMMDPTTCMDGHTYERKAIEQWLAQHDTSPLTGCKLPTKHLIPNFALRSAIDEAGLRQKK